nr:Cof-type HAD-IIB family hydrolase [Ardenticatena sp.]
MNETTRWLIALDLDGTLFDHDLRIHPRVAEAIGRARAAGHVVTLATGRMYCATRPFAEPLGIAEPLICYQGALVRSEMDVLLHLTLPLTIAREAIAFAQMRGIHVNLYLDDVLYVAEMTPEAMFYHSLSPMAPVEVVGDLLAFLQHEPTKIVFVCDEAETPTLLTEAAQRWGQQAQVVQSHARFVELTHPQVSKGQALLLLAAHLGIPRDRTLAIGDNHNDESMLRAAAVGVAMGNALPEVQAIADWVAPPVEAQGVAVTLERFVLTDEGAGA